MTIGSSYLLVGNGQVLILVGSELRTSKEVHCTALVRIELVDDRGCIAPAYQVEEALRLHGQLQTTFHLDNPDGLVFAIGAVVHAYSIVDTILGGITGHDAVLCQASGTLAHLVDQLDGLGGVAQLSLSLGTHQQHIGIAEHDAVHGRCPLVVAVEEIDVAQRRVYVLLQ